MSVTHLCPRCGNAREVDRHDISSITDVVPRYVWGRWDRCPVCDDESMPVEVLDANDPEVER